MPEHRPIYLDCAATTPLDPRVRQVMLEYFDVEYGNAGSRTHVYGQEAAKAVKRAREQVGAVVDASPMEVIFTSGATESNNIAILGLAPYAEKNNQRHIITTAIEHKAVLEPTQELERRGFEVEYVYPDEGGRISADDVLRRVREDTALISVMHVNNETGAIQPIDSIAEALSPNGPVFHVDAAQGFGKDIQRLQHPRIDLISASAHKICGPKGVGTLITRRKRKVSRKLTPLTFGGSQERTFRPGTLPVPHIVAFGTASELFLSNAADFHEHATELKEQFLEVISEHEPVIHGEAPISPYILNFSIPNYDAEILLIDFRDQFALATGSACTSTQWKPSHVISAMFNDQSPFLSTACRASWCHLTPALP